MDSVVVMKQSPSKRIIKTVRSVIRLLLMVVFLGYIMICIMMPTNTFWLHWLPDINARTNSTYLGQQGANILIYTFPILFIAALGCLYLHLGKRNVDHRIKNPRLASSWKQSVLAKGPLGIVSWTELVFLSMFIALLLWSSLSYIHAMFENISRKSAAKLGGQVWEVKLDSVALMFGLVGNLCLAFLFFPVTRASSLLQLVGLTSEASVRYHIWLGHIAMTLFTAHGVCYIIYWAATNQSSQMLKWNKTGVSNVAGEVALLSGLAMWATSHQRIRRKIFELFFYTHHLYIFFAIFFIVHVGFSSSCIMLPGFYLFLIDRYLRFLQSQQKVRLISARVLPCKAVELSFSKSPGLSYNPTSILFVNVPSISKLQWHPFTITSNCNMDPEKLCIVIKSEGSWSHKLYEKLSSPSRMDRLEVCVEGPYGPASTHFLRHDMLVMVSGGNGITPFISIIRELLFMASTTSCKTPKVHLICAFKKSLDLTMLDFLLPVSGTTFDISRLQLQIEAYVTREKEPATDKKKLPQTVWLKPSASDVPVSAILGPNNWLWLGTIISSSFVLFLLLIGILTRYYIYPLDHNTNMIYSYSSRSALYMLFICVSVALTATAVFLWNRKQNIKEMQQIQITNTPSPTTSPASLFYNADRELESLPHQSLNQATRVHYGERPNLKKILFECEGSSTGVLVSGPRKMRQEVATICSSGLADKVHFESISFSW